MFMLKQRLSRVTAVTLLASSIAIVCIASYSIAQPEPQPQLFDILPAEPPPSDIVLPEASDAEEPSIEPDTPDAEVDQVDIDQATSDLDANNTSSDLLLESSIEDIQPDVAEEAVGELQANDITAPNQGDLPEELSRIRAVLRKTEQTINNLTSKRTQLEQRIEELNRKSEELKKQAQTKVSEALSKQSSVATDAARLVLIQRIARLSEKNVKAEDICKEIGIKLSPESLANLQELKQELVATESEKEQLRFELLPMNGELSMHEQRQEALHRRIAKYNETQQKLLTAALREETRKLNSALRQGERMQQSLEGLSNIIAKLISSLKQAHLEAIRQKANQYAPSSPEFKRLSSVVKEGERLLLQNPTLEPNDFRVELKRLVDGSLRENQAEALVQTLSFLEQCLASSEKEKAKLKSELEVLHQELSLIESRRATLLTRLKQDPGPLESPETEAFADGAGEQRAGEFGDETDGEFNAESNAEFNGEPDGDFDGVEELLKAEGRSLFDHLHETERELDQLTVKRVSLNRQLEALRGEVSKLQEHAREELVEGLRRRQSAYNPSSQQLRSISRAIEQAKKLPDIKPDPTIVDQRRKWDETLAKLRVQGDITEQQLDSAEALLQILERRVNKVVEVESELQIVSTELEVLDRRREVIEQRIAQASNLLNSAALFQDTQTQERESQRRELESIASRFPQDSRSRSRADRLRHDEALIDSVADRVQHARARVLQLAASRNAAEIAELSRRYGDNHPDLIRAKQQLRDRIDQMFEARQAFELAQVEQIRRRLTELESSIRSRQESRRQIVDQYALELTEKVAGAEAVQEPESADPVLSDAQLSPSPPASVPTPPNVDALIENTTEPNQSAPKRSVQRDDSVEWIVSNYMGLLQNQDLKEQHESLHSFATRTLERRLELARLESEAAKKRLEVVSETFKRHEQLFKQGAASRSQLAERQLELQNATLAAQRAALNVSAVGDALETLQAVKPK